MRSGRLLYSARVALPLTLEVVMGARGPVPKRSTERARRNKVDTTQILMIGEVEIPEPDPNWHPAGRMVWDSLANSGQAKYFEPSDWAAAHLLCGEISRMKLARRHSAQMLAAVWAGMGDLLMTEADRRRAHVEIMRQKPSENADGQLASVTRLDRHRAL